MVVLLEVETEHLPPFSAEVKNAWSYTFTPQDICIAWRLNKCWIVEFWCQRFLSPLDDIKFEIILRSHLRSYWDHIWDHIEIIFEIILRSYLRSYCSPLGYDFVLQLAVNVSEEHINSIFKVDTLTLRMETVCSETFISFHFRDCLLFMKSATCKTMASNENPWMTSYSKNVGTEALWSWRLRIIASCEEEF
jgi:hypothetical protein